MGLELEMHGVHLSFLKIDAGRATWWPEPPQGVEEHDTMMAAEPLLEPTNPGKGFYKDGCKINWEGEWGLRGVGDNFTDNAFAGQDTPSTSCIIELSTSAVPVADWVYVSPQGFRSSQPQPQQATVTLPLLGDLTNYTYS